ncbi:MAG: 50S ribosomal protein L3 N(5)-glutamine methyltransferase [Oceanococcus sp.]
MAELHELSHLMTTPRDLIRWAASQFEQAELCYGHGCETALDEAASLVLQCLHLPHDLPAAYMDAVLTVDERAKVLQWIIRRRDKRLPLPYITGRAWFAGMPFVADARALIPRSPIAELIGEGFSPWLAEEPTRILDLCTGGGSIAIGCAHVFSQTPVDASDLSLEALEQAAENVALHKLQQRVELLQGDLFSACAGRSYDLIVSNPPYVSAGEYAELPAEFAHEPRSALEAPDQGLQLVYKMLEQAPDYLNPSGILVCEVGATAHTLMETRPDFPLHWAEFEHGGDGVFIISREDLISARSA